MSFVNSDENLPKSLYYLISQNPIPIVGKKKKKGAATEPKPNPYLYRKEEDEVGAVIGEERQEFEALDRIVRERERESVR